MNTRLLLTCSILLLSGCASAEKAAYQACQEEVKRSLRSPASAVFPRLGDGARISGDLSGTADVSISGYVDSQNSFGAMLRSSFHCTQYRKDGQWIVTAHVLPGAL